MEILFRFYSLESSELNSGGFLKWVDLSIWFFSFQIELCIVFVYSVRSM